MNLVMKKMIFCLCLCLSFNLLAAPSDNDGWGADSEHESYKLAVAAIDQQSYSEAIGHLDQLAKEEPKNADAYNLLGFSHRKMKNFETAERFYKKALAINPKHKGALEYLGELYVETKRIDQARAQLSKLDDACWFGCEEYDLLKSKIEAAESAK